MVKHDQVEALITIYKHIMVFLKKNCFDQEYIFN